MINKIDQDGLLLSKIQGEIFLKSLEETNISSDIFIRRYMNSNIVKSLDSKSFLDDSLSVNEVLNELNEEYSKLMYGKNQYSKEAIYWIGYIYRYMAYFYNLSSKQVYNIVKPKELNEMYYTYHTLDCSLAINNILEEKNISFDKNDLNAKLFKLLRNKKYKKDLSLKLVSNNKDNLKFDIIYNDKGFVGKIVVLKSNNKYYKFNISFNNAKFRNNNDIIIVSLEKAITYLKENLGNNLIDSLVFEVDKNNEGLIEELKKKSTEYIGETKNKVKLLIKVELA